MILSESTKFYLFVIKSKGEIFDNSYIPMDLNASVFNLKLR